MSKIDFISNNKRNYDLLKELPSVKVFEKDGKFNVVDKNNVFVGFDYQQDCCESFGHFFSLQKPVGLEDENQLKFESQEQQEKMLKGFIFDISFFEQLNFQDEENAAIFRLVKNEQPYEIFLVLYNCHNGYYAHGFEMKTESQIIHKGSL